MMADENVPATDATDDELAAVAGVLYLASAELDDYGVSVSEKKRWTVGVAVLGMDAREARSARAGKARLGGAQRGACASHALAGGRVATIRSRRHERRRGRLHDAPRGALERTILTLECNRSSPAWSARCRHEFASPASPETRDAASDQGRRAAVRERDPRDGCR
jgi:hypothetical protein